MNSTLRSSRTVLSVAVALAAGTFAACAPPHASSTSATSVTAADVPSTAVPAVTTFDSLPMTNVVAGAPAGQLVCKTRNALDGTTELFLEWDGPQAKGFLRRVAPSGMAYLQPVRAERHRGTIIVDDMGETDLVTHAAAVAEENGKPRMQLGDGDHTWSTCE